jgi:hypothetical protein
MAPGDRRRKTTGEQGLAIHRPDEYLIVPDVYPVELRYAQHAMLEVWLHRVDAERRDDAVHSRLSRQLANSLNLSSQSLVENFLAHESILLARC